MSSTFGSVPLNSVSPLLFGSVSAQSLLSQSIAPFFGRSTAVFGQYFFVHSNYCPFGTSNTSDTTIANGSGGNSFSSTQFRRPTSPAGFDQSIVLMLLTSLHMIEATFFILHHMMCLRPF